MKYLNVLGLALLISLHGKAQNIKACDSVPALNSKILMVLEPYMGQKILRGECWDVLSLALNEVHATWNGYDVFGTRYDYKKECISPGDIIAFKGVKFGGVQNGMKYFEDMEKHFGRGEGSKAKWRIGFVASEYREIWKEVRAVEYFYRGPEERKNGILSSAELIDPHPDSPFFGKEVIEPVSKVFDPTKLCSFK